MESGWCWKASACTFAHGLHEVHPDAQAQLVGQLVGGDGATTTIAAPVLRADAPVFAPVGVPPAEGAAEASGEQPSFPFNADASPFVFNQASGCFQLNADAEPFEMAQATADFKFNADAASFEPPTASLAGQEANSNFAFNADAQPFKPIPLTIAEQDNAAAEPPKTPPRQSIKVEEVPQTPVARPGLTLPGVSARTIGPRSPIASPTLVKAASPEPLPSPAAAAALKFIKRNPALVPATPNSQNMLVQSPCSVPHLVLPMQLFKATEDSTRENTTGSHVTELSSTARSRTSSAVFSVRSPSLCAAQSPQWTPQSPLAAPPPLALPLQQSPELRPVGQPISRGVLLQAGLTLRQGLQLGPPGLANYAPTPTSKAKLAGFALPQPGLISVQPVSTQPVSGMPRRGSA